MTRDEAITLIASRFGIPRSVVEQWPDAADGLTSALCEECQGEGEYPEWSFWFDGRPSVKTVNSCPDCGGSGLQHREVE